MATSSGSTQRSQRLAADRLDRYRAYGAFGKPVFQSYVQLVAMLKSRKGDRIARYFAQPVFNEETGELHWHTELVGTPRAWSTIPPEEQAKLALRMEVVRSALAGLIRDLQAAPDQGAQGGSAAYANLLERSLKVPADGEFLYFVGDQPISVFWGFHDSDGRSVESTAVSVPRFQPIAQGQGLVESTDASTDQQVVTPPPAAVLQSSRKRWWWLLLLLLPLLLLFAWWWFGAEDDEPAQPPPVPSDVRPPDAAADPSSLPPGHPCAVAPEKIKADPALAAQCADILQRRSDWSSSISQTEHSSSTQSSSVTGQTGSAAQESTSVGDTRPSGDGSGQGAGTSDGAGKDQPSDAGLPPTEEGQRPTGDPSPPPAADQPPVDPPADRPLDPASDKPGDKPGEKPGDSPADKPGDKPGDKPADSPGQKPGDKPDAPLQLPADKPGSAGPQDLGFLQGNWSPGFPMQDPNTGLPLDVNLEFDKGGKGQFVVKRPDGTICRGDIAGQMTGGRLSIAGAGAVPCQGGGSFAAPKIDCENDRGGRTNCSGINPDGSRFNLPLTRR